MPIVSVCSLKGGVGKTSVLLGLASAAGRAGRSTLVVDLDPQADATVALDVDVEADADVAAVLARPRRRVLERAVQASRWPAGPDVLPGSPRSAEFDSPDLDRTTLVALRQALTKRHYDLVLIDSPPSLGGLTRIGWVAAGVNLVVTEPGLFAVAAADRAVAAMAELSRHGWTVRPDGIVVNRMRATTAEHDFRMQELRRMYGDLVWEPAVPERSVVQQAAGALRPVHLLPGTAAAEVSWVFDRLLARLVPTPESAPPDPGPPA